MDIYNAHAAWLSPPTASRTPESTEEHPAPSPHPSALHHPSWDNSSRPVVNGTVGAGGGGGNNGGGGGASRSDSTSVNGAHVGQSAQNLEPSLDLDFLSGLDVPSVPASSMAANSYYPYLHHLAPPPNNHFSPYASANGWPSSTSSPTVPLSNYSTLNGATSPPPPQPAQQPMLIDPVLTSLSPPPAPAPIHSPTSYLSGPGMNAASPPPSSMQQHPYQYAHLMHNYDSNQAAYAHLFSMQNQRAVQQQQQTTLSPQVLHSPPPTTISPTQFYPTPSTTPAPPPAPAPAPASGSDNSLAQLETKLRPLLLPDAFTGAGAVRQLVRVLEDHGALDVPIETRLKVLTRVRDNAGNNYFRAWHDNANAIDLTREWLRAGVKGDDGAGETVMPLLHIIDRLPFTLESLKESKLGKIIMKLVKEPPSQGVQDMASKLERAWRSLIDASSASSTTSGKSGEEPDGDTKPKKRKLEPASKATPPAKKQAVTTPTGAATTKSVASNASSPAAKKPADKKPGAPGPTAPTPVLKDAKSDSSFFSSSKPKPKLPSFRKGAPPPGAAGAAPGANVAQPSSVDPFQEALAAMRGQRKESPAQATPPPLPQASVAGAPSSTPGAVAGKKRKRVTWAPEAELEKVQLITKAVYDDDPMDGTTAAPSHDIRDLERAEGAALHAHASFEELIDWTEPLPYEIPDAIEFPPRGEQSTERQTQEEREKNALSALYMTAAQIPDSPFEPPVPPPADPDAEVKVMLVGAEAESAFFGSQDEPTAPHPPVSNGTGGGMVSVSDLVGQLSGSVPPSQQQTQPNMGLDPNMLAMMQSMPPEQLQQFIAQANQIFGKPAPQDGQQPQPQPPQPQPYYGNGADEWQQGGQLYPDQAGPQTWGANGPPTGPRGSVGDDGSDRDGRGRGGGRGRGRGKAGFRNKRIPCSFYAQGRCRYGDSCDFSHDLPA